MLRRERYVGRIIWNRTRFIKRPGTNKRVCRPRPKSEWSTQEAPELRIVDGELWTRVQDRLVQVKALYGRGGRNGLMNRAADSSLSADGPSKMWV
jgi:site-specific DNA recombinase